VNWYKQQILSYPMASRGWFSQISLPEDLTKYYNHMCKNQQHIYMIEQLYSNIVMSLKMAEHETTCCI